MDEVKILTLLKVEADKYNNDIKIEERGVFNKLTFVFEDCPPIQKKDEKGKLMVDKEGNPIMSRYYFPCYKSPESYVIPSVYPEFSRIFDLLSQGVPVKVKVIVSDVEFENKTYKRILVENLRKITIEL